MKIDYYHNKTIGADEFKSLLIRSTLGERRPVNNETCIQGMIENSNLVISAWYQNKLVGIARSMTDFHYACYLSDLAVDKDYQQQGMGKQLVYKTKQALEPSCKLILIAAPAANEYYSALGFTHNERCWVLE